MHRPRVGAKAGMGGPLGDRHRDQGPGSFPSRSVERGMGRRRRPRTARMATRRGSPRRNFHRLGTAHRRFRRNGEHLWRQRGKFRGRGYPRSRIGPVPLTRLHADDPVGPRIGASVTVGGPMEEFQPRQVPETTRLHAGMGMHPWSEDLHQHEKKQRGKARGVDHRIRWWGGTGVPAGQSIVPNGRRGNAYPSAASGLRQRASVLS